MAVGEKAIAPLKHLAEPMMIQVQPIPFPAMQSILDDAYPHGTRNYWKSAYVKDLSDAAIDILVEQAKGMTSPMSALLIEFHGGASARAPSDKNAFAQRRSDFRIGFMPQWTDASEDAAHIAWARGAWNAIQPHSAPGFLLSYLSEDEQNNVSAAFGSNYAQLRELKKAYDPTNFFSVNQNILPAA